MYEKLTILDTPIGLYNFDDPQKWGLQSQSTTRVKNFVDYPLEPPPLWFYM